MKDPINEAVVLGQPKIELNKLPLIVPGEKLAKNFAKEDTVLTPEKNVIYVIPSKIHEVKAHDKKFKKVKNIDLNFSLMENITPIIKNNKTKNALAKYTKEIYLQAEKIIDNKINTQFKTSNILTFLFSELIFSSSIKQP